MQLATFGAGCFWGVEAAFQNVKGVVSTTVGYTGGTFDNPSYEDVCTGITGHAEAVQIEFDQSVVSYEELLDIFWKNHDPTTLNRQGPDVGTQYRSVIFYHSPEQKEEALASRDRMQSNYKQSIVTEIVPVSRFYPAEEYHQRYFEKQGIEYCKTQ